MCVSERQEGRSGHHPQDPGGGGQVHADDPGGHSGGRGAVRVRRHQQGWRGEVPGTSASYRQVTPYLLRLALNLFILIVMLGVSWKIRLFAFFFV